MTGPIDESRHPIVHVGEDNEVHTYTPKPWRELTHEDRTRIRELKAIEELQHRLYAERAQRPPRNVHEEKENDQ